MKNTQILNTNNLKYKVLKDISIFLLQSIHFKNIDFRKFNKIPYEKKLKCLYLSKNISEYMCKNSINDVNSILLIKIISTHFRSNDLKMYIKNIELVKFYTILFTEKPCSHLTFYLFNNINLKQIYEYKNYLSVVLDKNEKYSLILNENLNVFIHKYVKHEKGKIFFCCHTDHRFSKFKQKLSILFFVTIVSCFLIYNIPSNHIILEMNLTIHIKTNYTGHIISCKSKTKSAKNMVKQINKLNPKTANTIRSFMYYGLENDILKPKEKVKIYVIGPPLKNKVLENLKCYLEDIPLSIVINNSGNLIKINRTF